MDTYEAVIELGNLELNIDIHYRQEPIIPGTYYDPPEGGEIEVVEVVVVAAAADGYCMCRGEIEGWEEDLDRLALDYVHNYFDFSILSEHQQTLFWEN